MSTQIAIEPLSKAAFAPFGDVLEIDGAADKIINQGLCGRYHDRADLDFTDGKPGISLFQSQTRTLPYALEMVERHPLGSQAFLPMSPDPFLVIVAPDKGGKPTTPRAFQTNGAQGVNYHRNTWHGVLTPLNPPGLFAVVDRIAGDTNLEEFWFDTPYIVAASLTKPAERPAS